MAVLNTERSQLLITFTFPDNFHFFATFQICMDGNTHGADALWWKPAMAVMSTRQGHKG